MAGVKTNGGASTTNGGAYSAETPVAGDFVLGFDTSNGGATVKFDVSNFGGGGSIGGSTGATDNRVLRSDGAGGATLQASPVTLDDAGNYSGIGNISLSGLVDGRDVAADGTKLDLVTVTQAVDLDSIESTVNRGSTFATSTDPATDAAVTTAIVDANSGVVVTLTATSNAQTIAAPTNTAAGLQFTVINNDSSSDVIVVNNRSVQIGEAVTFS